MKRILKEELQTIEDLGIDIETSDLTKEYRRD